MGEYKKVVLENHEIEQAIKKQVLNEAVAHVGLKEKYFWDTYEFYN